MVLAGALDVLIIYRQLAAPPNIGERRAHTQSECIYCLKITGAPIKGVQSKAEYSKSKNPCHPLDNFDKKLIKDICLHKT